MYLFKLSLIIVLFFLTLRVCTAQPSMVEVKYKYFKIVYFHQDEKRAMAVLDVLKKNHMKLENFYGVQPPGIVSIILPNTLQQFQNLTGGNLPHWSSAVYIPHKNAILLKKTAWISGDVQLTEELSHELSHVYFYQKFKNQSIPLWFNEGLAEYLSRENIDLHSGIVISNALFAGKFVSLSDIDSLLMFSVNRAQLAYLESLTAVHFLNNKYIQNEWKHFFSLIEQSSFDHALQTVTNMDKIDFELKWYRWLEDKYRWFVVFNLENLIWVGMIIVLIGALYAIRYRNRKILKKWEYEESISGDYDVPPETSSDYFKH